MCILCNESLEHLSYVEAQEFAVSVAFVAEWLDEKKSNWFTLVDIDILDMNSCELCIFGRVFDEEYKKECFTNTWIADGFDFGWNLAGDEGLFGSPLYAVGTLEYQFTEILWIHEINTRRNLAA